MKKCVCILLTACVFLSLFGCSETPKATDKSATPDTTASPVVDNIVPTDEPSEDVTVGDDLWYEKIDFEKQHQNFDWSNVIIEKSGSFYYAAKDGLYRYDTVKKEDKRIIKEAVKNILLYNDEIYCSVTNKVYKLVDDSGKNELIWDNAMFSQEIQTYDEVFDFMIEGNCLYIVTGALNHAICYNMETKESEWMFKKPTYVGSFNYFYPQKDYYYYIPYRSFQIHGVDHDGTESVMLRGDGLSEYDENHMLYDGLEPVNGELYYFRRVHNDLYKYNENGEDELIFKLPEESDSSLKVLHSVHNDKLYFAEWTGSVYTIYEYSGSGEPTVVFDNISSTAFELEQCSVTDSAIFWLEKTGEDSTKVCMKTR